MTDDAWLHCRPVRCSTSDCVLRLVLAGEDESDDAKMRTARRTNVVELLISCVTDTAVCTSCFACRSRVMESRFIDERSGTEV